MPSIVGTWRLVAAAAKDSAGRPLPPPYGGKGMGRVTFNAEGRMMAVVCDGRPQLPPGTKRDYSSYCGNYTFDGARLVTRVDAAFGPRPDRYRPGARGRFRRRAHGIAAAAAPDGIRHPAPEIDLGADRGPVAGRPARQAGPTLGRAATGLGRGAEPG